MNHSVEPGLDDTARVRQAVQWLKAFSVENHTEVRGLLPMWAHFESLTEREMLAVLAHFTDDGAER